MLNKVCALATGGDKTLAKMVVGILASVNGLPASASLDRGLETAPHKIVRLDLDALHKPEPVDERFHQLKPDDFKDFGLTDLTDILEGKEGLPDEVPVFDEN